MWPSLPCGCLLLTNNFYSHIPCGMWHYILIWINLVGQFLLTHPVWDVTLSVPPSAVYLRNFYSHIPCGMWLRVNFADVFHNDFYSHIPCGMWPQTRLVWARSQAFLLTHPVWDVTQQFLNGMGLLAISTHTSRVGCDKDAKTDSEYINDFYSHIPCGMWLKEMITGKVVIDFYSHIPCGMWPTYLCA